MIAASCTIGAGCSVTPTPQGPSSFELNSPLGILKTTLHLPAAPQPPAVLLIGDYGDSAEVWTPLLAQLEEQGYGACAVELPQVTEKDADWLRALPALEQALRELSARGCDPGNLFVAGAGLGAGLALHLGAQTPAVQGVVLLSPGIETHGVRTAEIIRRLDRCPLLILVSEGDALSVDAAEKLDAAAQDFHELRSYAGNAHGADILATAPGSVLQAVDWLNLVRGPGNAPAP